LALQDQVTQTQIINCLKEQYGDQQTFSHYARFVIRSFVAWGVLKDSEAKGCMKKKTAPVSVADASLDILMFESALLSGSQRRIEAAPEQSGIFPIPAPRYDRSFRFAMQRPC